MDLAQPVACYRYDGKAKVEILLGDSRSPVYFQNGVVHWHDRCKGLAASTFPRAHGSDGGVPFKYAQENHLAALEGFSRAFLNRNVDEPPKFLMIVEMDLDIFDNCIQEGSIAINANMQTVSFMHDVTMENYQSLTFEFMEAEAMIPAFDEMTDRLREKREYLLGEEQVSLGWQERNDPASKKARLE